MDSTPKQVMRLYVWENVLSDYTPGMIVALSPDIGTAVALAEASDFSFSAPEEMRDNTPEVIELGSVDAEPKFWAVHGGG